MNKNKISQRSGERCNIVDCTDFNAFKPGDILKTISGVVDCGRFKVGLTNVCTVTETHSETSLSVSDDERYFSVEECFTKNEWKVNETANKEMLCQLLMEKSNGKHENLTVEDLLGLVEL
jgi:hypothetical protein